MPRNPVAAQGEVELSRRTHDAAAEDATVSRTGARSHKRASLFASWLSSSLRLDNQQHLVGAGFDPAVFAAPIIYWVAWHFQRAVHVGSTGGGDIFSALLESGGPRTLDFNYAGGWFCFAIFLCALYVSIMTVLCAVLITHHPAELGSEDHPCIKPLPASDAAVPAAPRCGALRAMVHGGVDMLFSVKPVKNVKTFYDRAIKIAKVNALSSGIVTLLSWVLQAAPTSQLVVNLLGIAWVVWLSAAGTSVNPFHVARESFKLKPGYEEVWFNTKKWLSGFFLVFVGFLVFGGFSVISHFKCRGGAETDFGCAGVSQLSLMEVWFSPFQLLVLVTFAMPLIELENEARGNTIIGDSAPGAAAGAAAARGGGGGGDDDGEEEEDEEELTVAAAGCFSCGRVCKVLLQLLVQTLGPLATVLYRFETSVQRAVQEIVGALVIMAVIIVPALPLIYRGVQTFVVRSGAGTSLLLNLATHLIVLRLHQGQNERHVTQSFKHLEAELEKANGKLVDARGDLAAFAAEILGIEDHITRSWQWARPMIATSVSWYTISLAAAYGVMVEASELDLPGEYVQPLFQAFTISAVYFAYISLQVGGRSAPLLVAVTCNCFCFVSVDLSSLC